MDDADDDDMYPADDLAAQMGFSSFGGERQRRPAKRTKHVGDAAASASGATTSSPALGSRMTVPAAVTVSSAAGHQPGGAEAESQVVLADPETAVEDGTGRGLGQDLAQGPPRPSSDGGLDARRRGPPERGSGRGQEGQVGANELGDPVYFDPSFLEDPWAGLQPRRWGERGDGR